MALGLQNLFVPARRCADRLRVQADGGWRSGERPALQENDRSPPDVTFSTRPVIPFRAMVISLHPVRCKFRPPGTKAIATGKPKGPGIEAIPSRKDNQ